MTVSQTAADGAMLAGLWRSWAERGSSFGAAEWAAATRLPGWSVQALYAHVAPDPAMFSGLRDALVAGPAAVTAGAEVLRIYNRPGGVAHTAAGSIEAEARRAAETDAPEALIGRFERGLAALEELADVPPDAAVAHPLLGTVAFGALGEVAVMEATVHLLDLVAAVGGPPVPRAALHVTRNLLAAVPDPVAFIEAATGRAEPAVLPVMR